MLKELKTDAQNKRHNQMLLRFMKELEKNDYSPETRRSYAWHLKRFQDYCDAHETTPKEISKRDLGSYLRGINREVKVEKKSRPYLLQACSTLEIAYRTVLHDSKKAQMIPEVRRTLSA